MSKPDRIVAVGGCHVVGFPFPLEASFVNRLASDLSLPAEHIVQRPNVGMKRLAPTLAKVAPFASGDLIILQLGHFDSIKSLWPGSRNIAGEGSASSSSPSSDSLSPSGSGIATRSMLAGLARLTWLPEWMRMLLKTIVRSTLFSLRELIGKPAFLPEVFAESLEQAIDQVAFPHPRSVMVLAAFPCADWTTNCYRRRLNAAMQAVCAKNGFTYVETYGVIHQAGKSGVKVMLDAIHITEAAHGVVAQELLRVLKSSD